MLFHETPRRGASLPTAAAALILAVALLCLGVRDGAAGFRETFIDSTDNHLDMSRWLDQAFGFMPLMSIITEPAVGFGLAGGVFFLHRPEEERGKPITSPPSMSGVGGFYTENGSWGTGAFYEGHWRQDRYRYRGVLGYVSVNLDFYPARSGAAGSDDSGYEFNIEGAALTQRLEFRIRQSPWFLGAQYVFFKNSVKFDLSQVIPGQDERQFDSRIGGLSPLVVYDSRDNIFTTSRGMRSQLIYNIYNEIFGSDTNFTNLDCYWLGWYDYRAKFVFGLRLDGRLGDSDAPFYMLPYIHLRGIPAMRYQGRYTVVAETEERWNFHPRWALVGFFGLGKAVPEGLSFSEADLEAAGGAGFRYLMARQYGVFSGIDVARGPERWAVYIQFGQYWNSF